MTLSKRSTSPSYNIGDRAAASDEADCKHNRKYLNKFLTFQYWYCPDCKEEISKDNKTIAAKKETPKSSGDKKAKSKPASGKAVGEIDEDKLLEEFENMLGQSYYEDEDDDFGWFVD